MFDPSDPRATLAAKANIKPAGPFTPALPADFSALPPIESANGYSVHYWRARNLLLAVVELDGQFSLTRRGQVDEFAILTLDAITVTIKTGDAEKSTPGNHLMIVPPGDSDILATGKGTLTLLFSPRNNDIAEKCPNNREFDQANPRISAFQPWPDPPEGFKIRTYDLDIEAEQGRFGRIFRCTTMMINVLDPRLGPRDPAMVSPHHHDDFEQVSLALKGSFRHLIRWPWTSNIADWREDVAINLGSPSACVIPPPAIHTSLSTAAGENQLIDLFAPPRLDFSLKPGWVLNADDYPLPAYAKDRHDV